MADPGLKASLTLVPADTTPATLERYGLSGQPERGAVAERSLLGRRLLQLPPVPTVTDMLESSFYDYDDLVEADLGPSLNATSGNTSSSTPAPGVAENMPSGTLVGGYMFDLLEDDTGYPIQDLLPQEQGTITFEGVPE
jgi:hypothetical protein